MLVTYYSNNSGGQDWLSMPDWRKLENAGWKLFDFTGFIYTPDKRLMLGTDGLPQRDGGSPKRPRYAIKVFKDRQDGVDEWATILDMDPEEEGCECCGRPHEFD